MTVFYKINSGPDGSVLSLFGDLSDTITSDHPHYLAAVNLLLSSSPEDIDVEELQALVSPRVAVEGYIKRVSDRVSFQGNRLLFDGDVVDNSLSETIIRLSVEDTSGDPTKLVKFLENLMNNPSEHSRTQLYDWIARRDLTITNDGHFLAYKGLRSNKTSIHSGPGIVNNVSYTNAYLDNSPGNILEISRSTVDSRSDVGCSTGLHAGTREYAENFAPYDGVVVLVKINPRDVVSVPTDCDAQKLRVSRYEVIEISESRIESVLFDESDDDYDDDEWNENYDPDLDYYEDEDDFLDDGDDEEEDEDEDDLVEESSVEEETPEKYKGLRKFFGNKG